MKVQLYSLVAVLFALVGLAVAAPQPYYNRPSPVLQHRPHIGRVPHHGGFIPSYSLEVIGHHGFPVSIEHYGYGK
ncbi:hypothetical protein O3P69_019142 [Scylla paramamosain]|uniref:Uncharacterized protein n=1 Tax=Scylla paramamosain TaxID=85552 RepID=A0AAW0SV02_SCYPA